MQYAESLHLTRVPVAGALRRTAPRLEQQEHSFTEPSLCAPPPEAEGLISTGSLNPHSHSKKKVVLLPRPYFRWANNLPKVARLSNKVRIPAPVRLEADLVLFPVRVHSLTGTSEPKGQPIPKSHPCRPALPVATPWNEMYLLKVPEGTR